MAIVSFDGMVRLSILNVQNENVGEYKKESGVAQWEA